MSERPGEPPGAGEGAAVDPFDLPEWLGVAEVTWRATDPLLGGAHVHGELLGGAHEQVPCDLLAVDEAYPQPVAGEALRREAHLAWQHDQVHMVELDRRVTLVVPGTGFTADGVLAVLARLAKAVGARPERYAAWLRIGAPGPGGARPGG